MILMAMRRRLGDRHWMDEENLGPIPNGDGTFRQGPRMTSVYDNGHMLFQLALIMNLIAAIAWGMVIFWLWSEYGTKNNEDYLMAAIINIGGLSFISSLCFGLTVCAVRAERLMVIIAIAKINNQPIMGMHDDWQRFEEEPEIVAGEQMTMEG